MSQLPPFNDIITGREAPHGYGGPMVRDVVLDGTLSDIYHTDHSGGTGHRVFIPQAQYPDRVGRGMKPLPAAAAPMRGKQPRCLNHADTPSVSSGRVIHQKE